MKKSHYLAEHVKVRTAQKISEILQGIHNEEIEQYLSHIQALATKPLNLAIMGEFSAGKSSFINRLLDTDALPVAIMPKTALVTKLVYGTEPRVEIKYLVDKQIIVKEYFEYDCLKNIQNACKIDNTDLMKEINSIIEVCVFINNPLLKRFIVLDTPGFNHDERMDQKTNEILDKVDIVVWLSDFSQLAKKTEFEHLERVKEQVSQIYLVINKADIHISNDSDYKKSYGCLPKELSENKFIDFFSTDHIFLVSSKQLDDFWSTKFNQFSANFGREVLINNTIQSYSDLNSILKPLQEFLIASDKVPIYAQNIYSKIDKNLKLLWNELEIYWKKNDNLSKTKIDSLNTYISKYLYLSVDNKFYNLQHIYHDIFNEIFQEYIEELTKNLILILEKIPSSIQHIKKDLEDIFRQINNTSWSLRLEKYSLPTVYHWITFIKDKTSITEEGSFLPTDIKKFFDEIHKAFMHDVKHDLFISSNIDILIKFLKSIEIVQRKELSQLLTAQKECKNIYE